MHAMSADDLYTSPTIFSIVADIVRNQAAQLGLNATIEKIVGHLSKNSYGSTVKRVEREEEPCAVVSVMLRS